RKEWHSLWLADPSFVGVLFQQAQASEAAAAPIPCLSCRLQSEGRRADIAGELFQSKAWCSPSNLANPTESHPTEITHLFFGQALRRRGHSPLLMALGELHGRNLASALMRSRVHNRTSDRGGKPIQLAAVVVGIAPGPSRTGGAPHSYCCRDCPGSLSPSKR